MRGKKGRKKRCEVVDSGKMDVVRGAEVIMLYRHGPFSVIDAVEVFLKCLYHVGTVSQPLLTLVTFPLVD